ncbi:hypothetical protein HYV86_07280 [Candidatus Woesearchaeota archaeon]|nr:hypothetical protein [Candidatus Woesearchaeota archaeon]
MHQFLDADLQARFEQVGNIQYVGNEQRPVLELTPFNVAAYEDAIKRDARTEITRLAKPMGDANLAIGFGALRDEGRFLPPELMHDAYEGMDLLFSLDPTILKQFPGDRRKTGYIAPGEERYDSGPELWKSSWYHSITGNPGNRKYHLGWPNVETTSRFSEQRTLQVKEGVAQLEGGPLRGLTVPEKQFLQHAFTNVFPKVHRGFDVIGRLALSGLVHGVYGLEADHFFTGAFVDENREGYGTTRLLLYYTGPQGKIGDIIAGRHQDSSLSAIIDPRKDTNPIPSLEVEIGEGKCIPVRVGEGNYSFNIGWLLVNYVDALAKAKMGVAETAPRTKLLPTFHQVVRRNLAERPVFVHFPDGDPNALITDKTFRQIAEEEFSRYVGHLG